MKVFNGSTILRYIIPIEIEAGSKQVVVQGGLENSKISGQKLAWVPTLGY